MIKNNNKRGDYSICPYVGNREDAETAQLYLSNLNCCNHAKPVTQINFEKQRIFCLTSGYNSCPVFVKEKVEKLPKEFVGTYNKKINNHVSRMILLFFVVILGMLFIAQATGFIQIPIIDNMSIFQSRATQTMVPPATQIINQIVVKSTLTPTKTLFPTNAPILQTPTETEPHQLETPFGEKSMFVIHRVTEGESFINLASTYKTTKEAILAINYNLQPVLWANSLIAIPVGITDVSGLPAFTIYTIDKEGITVEGLASSQSIDVNLLQKYNVLPDGYTFKIGEIVLVPHSESAK